MIKTRVFPLFIVFYLLFVSCDLFTGPKVDLLQVISDEVDWANAEKLTVRLNFPSIWGTSNPPQGLLTPAMDIRRGFKFNVEFTPETTYTLGSWQVYRTAELDKLGNWLENISLINPQDIEPLGPNEIILPDPNPSGGTFNFTLFTADPVTLIPWCDKRPRITRTEPRDVNLSSQPVSRLSEITLYFNCALDAGTVRLADSKTDAGIWITAKGGDENEKGWFYNPVYAVEDGFFTVTLSPMVNTKLPASSLITVTVQGITNVQGEEMDMYSFSYNTAADTGVSLNSWRADYDEKTRSIIVSWTEQGNANKIEMYYRVNNGAIEHNLTRDDNNDNKISIPGIPEINITGVREGRQVSGIREYKIFIELYSELVMESRASFKIWNIPGMTVSDTNPVVEIRTATELAAIKDNLSGHYALANDITVTSAWMPVGAETAPFTGKLYGNGHTITLNSGIGDSANHRGLFGYAQGLSASQPAVIRDFTFEYNSSDIINVNASNSDFNIGGMAGFLKNTTVSNIITSGGRALAVDAAGNGNVRLGGIAGYVENGFIANCRADMNVALQSNGGAGDAGAVAGFAKFGSGGSIEININPPWENPDYITIDQLAIDGVTVTATVSGNTSGKTLSIGGAVGSSSGSAMRDIIVLGGGVSFDRTAITEETYVGGVTGYAVNSNMENCSFAGDAIGSIDDLNKIYARMGGLIGYYETNSGNVYINNCHVRGNIKIEEGNYSGKKYDSGINIGGILGISYFKGTVGDTVYITNSFFKEGEITAITSSGSAQAGGFCGSFFEDFKEDDGPTTNSHHLNNCGVMAGNVEVEVKNYGKYVNVGGFISSLWLGGTTKNCFSRANVKSRGIGNSNEEAGITVDGDNLYGYTHQSGGFSGALTAGATLESCYATGNVISEHDGARDLTVGGLVGTSGGIIRNCYALGDVSANKIAGASYTNIDGTVGSTSAGGLVGYAYNGAIQNSFSAGKVITAQSKEYEAYTGGIVGFTFGTTSNTAVLGEKVTARGPAITEAGRIAGNSFSLSNNLSNNYAINTMTTGTGAYGVNITGSVPGTVGLTTINGQNASISEFISASWWQKTLGFDPSAWDFSTPAVYRGYPLLKGLDGQI